MRRLLLPLTLLVLVSVTGFAQTTPQFVKDPYNPIITGIYPNAVKVGGTWHLFYDPAVWHQRINYATSTDDGQTWTSHGTVINPGQSGFNYSDVTTGTVLYENGQFHLYYSACYQEAWDVIGLAHSFDGLVWTNDGIILARGGAGAWDSYAIDHPKVFRDFEGSLCMIYLGYAYNRAPGGFGLAKYDINTGTWQKDALNPVMLPGGGPDNFDNHSFYNSGSAFYWDGLYYHFYSGFDTSWDPPGKIDMGWATSADLVSWQKHGRLYNGDSYQAWEGGEIFYPNVIFDDNRLVMFYCNYRSNWHVGMAQWDISPGALCVNIYSGANPPLPVQGVLVTILDVDNNTVVDPLRSDDTGEAHFDSIESGVYSVMIIKPLGYTVLPAETQIDLGVSSGICTPVNFALTPIAITNDCRTIGYWKHQFNVYTSGRGEAQEATTDLTDYLALVHQHFDVLDVYVDLVNFDFEDAKDILTVRGGSLMVDRAKQQLFALLLNFASARIGNETVVSQDGRVAAEAVALVAGLVNDGDPINDDLAKTVCDQINNNILVDADIIPVSPIRYKVTSGMLPSTFDLSQNFPNPFNPTTTIEYALPEAGRVTLEIFDLLGRRVATLEDGEKPVGFHQVTWNAADMPSGLYFYRLQAGEFSETKKMLLMK